jgi:hypothetical protein
MFAYVRLYSAYGCLFDSTFAYVTPMLYRRKHTHSDVVYNIQINRLQVRTHTAPSRPVTQPHQLAAASSPELSNLRTRICNPARIVHHYQKEVMRK